MLTKQTLLFFRTNLLYQITNDYLSVFQFQQEEAVRLCLKHLRQNDYQEAFASLQKQAHLDLEHPLLTELHHELVQEGDYTKAELIFTRAVSGEFMYHLLLHDAIAFVYLCILYMHDLHVYMYVCSTVYYILKMSLS